MAAMESQNAPAATRPRTAHPHLLPQPFSSTTRFVVLEPSPRPSFNEILFAERESVLSKDERVFSRTKDDNRLKRTFEGLATNVEKMARRLITPRPTTPSDSSTSRTWQHQTLRSRRSPSLRDGRRTWTRSSRIEKTHQDIGPYMCGQSYTKWGLALKRSSKMELNSSFDDSISPTFVPPSTSSRALLSPNDFPAQAGAGARAAVAAASIRTRPSTSQLSCTEHACQMRHQNDTPIDDLGLASPYEHRRDDSVHDSEDGMDIDMASPVEDITLECITNPLTRLPFELVENILTHLDVNTLEAMRQVSKGWKNVAESNAVWRSVFLRDYSPLPAYENSYLKIGGLGLGKPLRTPQDFRAMTMARQGLEDNWQKANPRAIYFCGHTDSVYCCQFDEDKIITGSRDRTIRVWDINTLKCLKVIGAPENRPTISPPKLEEHSSVIHTIDSVNGTKEGDDIFVAPELFHDASILCLQYDHEIMVTGSSDTTCIVWNVKTFEPIKQLRHHGAGVLDICFDDKYIISCSKDFTICVWSRETLTLIKTLKGHGGPVNAVQMRGNMLVSASGDGNAKLWDLSTMQCIRTFPSRDRGLAAVEFSDDGRYVLAGGNDQVIYKYNANTAELIHVYVGHSNLVRSLFLDCNNRRVLSGSYDQGMRVYDFDTGSELGVYNNWTTSWILAAKSDYRRIVATSQDGRVLMMDFGWDVPNIDMLKKQ